MTENKHIYVYGGAAIVAGIGLIYFLHRSASDSSANSNSSGQTQVTAADPSMPAVNTAAFGASFWPSAMGDVAPYVASGYSDSGEPVTNIVSAPAVLAPAPLPSTPTPIPTQQSTNNCCGSGCNFYANSKNIEQNVNYQNLMNDMSTIVSPSEGAY